MTLRELLALRADVVVEVGGEIDLVSLADASVVFAWEVVRYGECLYAADPADKVEFVTRAQSCYWDFKPFLDTQWELTGHRLKERLQRGNEA